MRTRFNTLTSLAFGALLLASSAEAQELEATVGVVDGIFCDTPAVLKSFDAFYHRNWAKRGMSSDKILAAFNKKASAKKGCRRINAQVLIEKRGEMFAPNNGESQYMVTTVHIAVPNPYKPMEEWRRYIGLKAPTELDLIGFIHTNDL